MLSGAKINQKFVYAFVYAFVFENNKSISDVFIVPGCTVENTVTQTFKPAAYDCYTSRIYYLSPGYKFLGDFGVFAKKCIAAPCTVNMRTKMTSEMKSLYPKPTNYELL